MPNIQAIKSAIPILFLFIIIGFITKLGYDNAHLQKENDRLGEDKKSLENEITQLNSKNIGLAETLKSLTEQVGEQNEIIKTESRRRAAAEMRQQRLHGEIAEMLRGEKCAVIDIPADVVDRLRAQADTVRGNQGTTTSDTSNPAN
ncbi:DUF2570 domain-containing protein [Enterobacteriaceae bacterium ESL0689]|nr:DUF2570 domain-containing protein [Enterobacteriaceae bacterium ESL0689]